MGSDTRPNHLPQQPMNPTLARKTPHYPALLHPARQRHLTPVRSPPRDQPAKQAPQTKPARHLKTNDQQPADSIAAAKRPLKSAYDPPQQKGHHYPAQKAAPPGLINQYAGTEKEKYPRSEERRVGKE